MKEETIDPLDLEGPFRCEVQSCLEILQVKKNDELFAFFEQGCGSPSALEKFSSKLLL
jgi:hypothetical protein